MIRVRRPVGLLALIVLAALVLAVWVGHKPLEVWTRGRLQSQQREHLARLPEQQAASFVQRLATSDSNLQLVARALEDERPAVAVAAEVGLNRMIGRWKGQPIGETSLLVADLATALAERAGSIPIERRPFVRTLARHLLEWPLDSSQVDAIQVLADCETLLRQPLLPRPPQHLAAIPPRPEFVTAASANPNPEDPDAATQQPDVAAIPDLLPPLTSPSQPPAPLVGASTETPVEPRQFLAPRANRLSNEQPPPVR